MKELLIAYLEPLLLFISGGGLATFATIKYTRKTAQADAMKSVQDVYQETIQDLREDKKLIKLENSAMRDQISKLDKIVKQNCADIRQLKGFKCVRMDCKERKTD